MLVEHDAGFSRLVEEMLASALPRSPRVACLERAADAEHYLRHNGADCLILDLGLPDARGLEAVRRLRQVRDDVPIVVLTGAEEEELAVGAFALGVQEFLVKSHTDTWSLGRAISYALQRKRAEHDLWCLALHDALTGLPNRVLFLDRLEVALARARRDRAAVALLFLDLDDFKSVNDRLGHAARDQLLAALARRTARAMRPSDTAARLGGDEFAVICEGIESEEDATRIAERVSRSIMRPVAVAGEALSMRASIGIALARSPVPTAEKLVDAADAAMYRAKRRTDSSVAL